MCIVSHFFKTKSTTTTADKRAPIVTRRIRGRSLPWLTSEVKQMMHERDLLHKKAIKSNKELHWSSYKRLRNMVTAKMRKEKSAYYTTQLATDKSSKDMWRTLNKILSSVASPMI